MVFFMALPAHQPEERPVTTSLREHWQHLQKVLAQVERMLTELPHDARERQDTNLYELDLFFTDGLMAHLEAEEFALFPVADQLEEGELPITTALRAENQHLRELATEFHRLAQKPERAIYDIQHVGLELYRYMHAHFIEEEKVLFPYLDERLTDEQVEELLARPMFDHNYGMSPTDHHISFHHMSRFHRPSG